MAEKGNKSSEWLSYIISLIGLIVASYFKGLAVETAAMYLTILTGVYIVARTIVKLTPTKKDDEVLQQIYDKILLKVGVKETKEEVK